MKSSLVEAVCDRCIEESSLAVHIQVYASLGYCTFCRRRSKKHAFAIPLSELLDHIRERLECEYEDAANSVGYESAEGGYQLPTMTSHELLDQVGLWVNSEELRDALASGLPDYAWVRRHPYSLPEEDALRLGWDEFARLIKHEVRYLLFPPETDSDPHETPRPAEMLEQLGDVFSSYRLV